MAPEPGTPWLLCRATTAADNGTKAGSTASDVTRPPVVPSDVFWTHKSMEQRFVEDEKAGRRNHWVCSPLAAQVGAVCRACRWFDADEPVCLGHECGHVDFGVAAQECLDGTFADAADADTWLKRDLLVHGQRYIAACTPPAGYVVQSAGSSAIAEIDVEAAGHEVLAAMEEALALLAGRPGILGPLLGCICCAVARGCTPSCWSRQRCGGWRRSQATPRAGECSGGIGSARPHTSRGFSERRHAGAHNSGGIGGLGSQARDASAFPLHSSGGSAASACADAVKGRAGHVHVDIGGSCSGDEDSPDGPRSLASSSSLAGEGGEDAADIIQRIHEELLENVSAPEGERKRLLRRHQMRWHPDKNLAEHRDTATAVTQFLNSKRAWFLGPSPSPESATLLP